MWVILKKSKPRLPDGGELLFCRHCWLAAKSAIDPVCEQVFDQSADLFEHVSDDHHFIEGKAAR